MRSCPADVHWSRIPITIEGDEVKIKVNRIKDKSSIAFDPENPLKS